MIESVSIITRCKNRKEHLRLSLKGMLAQTYCPKEVIVVDYDSSDGLQSMLYDVYGYYIKIGVLKVVRVDDQPYFIPAHAQNVGIRHAQGDWLMFMDADNIMKSFMLTHIMSRVIGQKRLFCRCYSDYMHLDKAGQMMCRKSDIVNIGGFLESLRNGWGYEDGDIRDRLLLYGCEIYEYSPSLTDVIEHAESERTGYMNEQDRRKSQTFNVEVARKNKMWYGYMANNGVDWGAGGKLVTREDTANGMERVGSGGFFGSEKSRHGCKALHDNCNQR